MDYTYPSFDLRLDEPERHQSVLNTPQPPLVKGDPVAVALLIGCAVLALCLFFGVVVWMPRS